MAGRKPIPIDIFENKNLRISNEKKEIRKKYPKISSCSLAAPKHLSDDARREWKKIVKLYKEMETTLINNLDRNAMEIYCNTMVTYRKAIEAINNSQEISVNKFTGKKIVNPWLAIAKTSSETLKKYGEMLLLDPISRARIGVANAKAKDLEMEDPMSQLLSQDIRKLK